MKCKLSKLFFLALIGAFSLKGYSQESNKVYRDTDLKLLNKLSKKYADEYNQGYQKALKVAELKGMPVNGSVKDGGYYSLHGIDEATGELVYLITSNNGATNSSVQTARTQDLYSGGSLGVNLQGQFMRLGIWDGGIPQASHENLGVTRVTNKDNTVVPDGGQEGVDHATHVAGTMIGNGSVKIQARGLAFNAFLDANDWKNDFAEMASQAPSLLVSNHSYGVRNDIYLNNPMEFGRYNDFAQRVDQITHAAQSYLPVFAAGNDRSGVASANYVLPNPTKGGYDLMVNYTASKNAVVVAAIEGFTNYTTAGAVEMTTFSQWGPTDDFRIKPDISAKGLGVYSSNMPYASSVNSYDSYPGTSMAAPAVSAVFILWQQYFKSLNEFDGVLNMRAASLKGLMAHTASEAGGTKGPDPRFGWGVINAKAGVEVLKGAYVDQPSTAVFKELTLQNDTEYVLYVDLDGSSQFDVTIAWTDPAGNVNSGADSMTPALVNDLDLRLYLPGDVSDANPVMPYALNKSFQNIFVAKTDNNVDPIEKVHYYNDFDGLAEPGRYKIKVKHKGTLTGGSQKFTLIASGGVVGYDETVSTNDFKFSGLKIYPNPVSDILNISTDDALLDGAKVTIYDMLGKRVYQNDSLFASSRLVSIDVSSLNAGVYLVEILKDNKVDTRKIVIN